MIKDHLALTKNILIYGFGRSSEDLAKFLLLPLYTRHLTPTDYAVISLVALFTSFLRPIMSLGTSTSVFRFYNEIENEFDRGKVFYSSLLLIIIWTFLIFVFTYQSRNGISTLLFDINSFSNFIVIGILTSAFLSIYNIPMFILRAEGKSQRFVINKFIKLFFGIVITIIFVVIFKRGAIGVLEASCLTSFLFAVYALSYQMKRARRGIDKSLFLKFFKFGLPLVFAGFSMVFLNSSGKYFLKKLSTLEILGVYSIGYTIGSGINLFIGAFQNAWPQFLFNYKDKNQASQFYGSVFTFYVAIMGVLWLLISIFSKEIVFLMTTKPFWDCYKVIPIVSSAYILYGAASITSAGIYIKDKTYNDYFMSPLSAFVCVVLNYFFIKNFGMIGAAWATFFSFFVLFCIYTLIGIKYLKIDFDLKRISFLLIIFLVGYAITLTPNSFNMVQFIIFKFILFIFILVLLISFESLFKKEYYFLKSNILK